MRKLDVKEIHGYDADEGPEAGARRRRWRSVGDRRSRDAWDARPLRNKVAVVVMDG